MLAKLKRWLGVDNRREHYRYDYDSVYGYTQARKIPQRWIKSTCGYCSVGCGMVLGVKDNEVIAVHGDAEHPVNEGKLCPKGLSEHYMLKSENRALYPLLKNSAGVLERVDWNEALKTMAERWQRIRAQHGPESVAILSTGQLVTEEFYTLGKLARLGMGVKHFDGNTTLCMSSAASGYKQSFGSDGPPGSYQGLETADLVFLIGANIADNHPILWYRLLKNQHKKLIVCDPRKTKTAMFADLYLPIRPRGDVDLLNGLIHLIIKKNGVDQNFVNAHTVGFDQLKAHAAAYTPELVSKATGLSIEAIEATADAILQAKRAFFAWTMGVNQSTQGTDTVSLINTLALITGHIGRTGSAPMSITGQCNAMGTREFGFTASMPGYRKYDSAGDRQELAALWGMDASALPTQRGWAYPDIIDGIQRGDIKALWVIGTNPWVSFPNQGKLREACTGLEFLVAQDGFHPTPTTEMADLVLPAAIWGEKDGSFTNSERRASRVRKAVDAPGEAKTDFEIFMRIAAAFNVTEKIFPNWQTSADAFEEMKAVSAGRLCDYSGMSYEAMERKGGIQWPCNAEHPDGKDSLYHDGQFETEDGKAKLWAVHSEPMPEAAEAPSRLILNTGRTVEHWHTRTKTGNVPILEKLAPIAWVEINPETAAFYEITPLDHIHIYSDRGQVRDVQVRITATVQPWQLFMPFHYVEANVNNLTLSAFCPKSRQPNYKQSAVWIEKVLRHA